MNSLLDQLNFQNLHWGGTIYSTPPYTRQLLKELQQDLSTPMICLLTGPRRTGKSILLKQLLNYLLQNQSVPSRQILFYEFSPHQPEDIIWTIYDQFTKNITNTHLPTYLFFDEIQYINGYETTIKLIYDQRPNTKIFLTGSLSLSYKQKMTESLAGRFFTHRLSPLSFVEYLSLHSPDLVPSFNALTQESDPFKRTHLISLINPHFSHFLQFGRYPEPLYTKLDTAQTQAYLTNIISQSLNQDAFNYFAIHKPQLMQSLFAYLQQNSGHEMSLTKVSNLIDTTLPTLNTYLDILEIMDLIYPVYNSISPLFHHNRNRKIYVNSAFQLVSSATELSTALGYAAESYAYERLRAQHPQLTYYRARNKEIDFVVPAKKLAYEIKNYDLSHYSSPHSTLSTTLLTPFTNPSLLTL
ncbi:MAG: AAA family ATPase [bacterium]